MKIDGARLPYGGAAIGLYIATIMDRVGGVRPVPVATVSLQLRYCGAQERRSRFI